MKRLLKIGDPFYAQSLKQFAPVHMEGFPQREQCLLEHTRDVEVSFFRHEVLHDIEAVSRERQRLAEYLSDRQFDFLMVDNPLSALVIDREVSCPILFDCIDWYDEMYLKEYGIDKRYHLLRYGFLDLLARADKVVAQSPVILEALKSWGLKTSATTVIPNGYDDRLFYRYPQEQVTSIRNELEARYKRSLADRKIVVYTGKLTAWYEGIKVVAEAIDDSQLLFIVGDGAILKDIPQRENVIKCGAVPVNEVPHFTNVADVLVFPVDSDCSPIVVSEYLAIGKPIVMPKGRINWLLKDGQSGCLVDNNPYSWRRGIKRALDNSAEIEAHNLGTAGELSWRKLAAKFSNFLNSTS